MHPSSGARKRTLVAAGAHGGGDHQRNDPCLACLPKEMTGPSLSIARSLILGWVSIPVLLFLFHLSLVFTSYLQYIVRNPLAGNN